MFKTMYAGWKLNIHRDNLFISGNKQNKQTKNRQTVGYHILNATKTITKQKTEQNKTKSNTKNSNKKNK